MFNVNVTVYNDKTAALTNSYTS